EGPQKGKVRRRNQSIVLHQSGYVVLPQAWPVMQVARRQLCEVVAEAVSVPSPFFGKDKAHEYGNPSPEALARNQFDFLFQDAGDRSFGLGEWRSHRSKNVGRRTAGFQYFSRASDLNNGC